MASQRTARAPGPVPSSPWSALRAPSFALLFGGYLASAVGNGMSGAAIAWLAIALAHGHGAGVLVGLAVAAYTLPGTASGLWLGRLLARWDPRLLILAEAGLRAAALTAVAAADALHLLTPAALVALLGLSSLLELLYVSGQLAAVVEMLPREQHLAGNSLLTTASFSGTIIGPALAGGVITLAGPGADIAADAASYGVLMVAIGLSRRFHPPPGAPLGGGISMVAALGSLRRQPAILGITILSGIFFAIYGPVEVALPLYVVQVLHAGPTVLGGFWTLFAIGTTIGALAASRLQRFGVCRVAVVVMAGWGACLIPLGLTDSVLLGLVALAVGGLIYGPFHPLKGNIIQRHGAGANLAALAAASAMITVSASPLGTALGGPLVAAVGPKVTILLSGAATIAAAALAVLVIVARRRLDIPTDDSAEDATTVG